MNITGMIVYVDELPESCKECMLKAQFNLIESPYVIYWCKYEPWLVGKNIEWRGEEEIPNHRAKWCPLRLEEDK